MSDNPVFDLSGGGPPPPPRAAAEVDIKSTQFDRPTPDRRPVDSPVGLTEHPRRLHCADMDIELVFDQSAPPLEEVLIALLIRTKSGLSADDREET